MRTPVGYSRSNARSFMHSSPAWDPRAVTFTAWAHTGDATIATPGAPTPMPRTTRASNTGRLRLMVNPPQAAGRSPSGVATRSVVSESSLDGPPVLGDVHPVALRIADPALGHRPEDIRLRLRIGRLHDALDVVDLEAEVIDAPRLLGPADEGNAHEAIGEVDGPVGPAVLLLQTEDLLVVVRGGFAVLNVEGDVPDPRLGHGSTSTWCPTGSITLRGRAAAAQVPEAPVQRPGHQRVARALAPDVMAEAADQGGQRVERAIGPVQALGQPLGRHLPRSDHGLEQVEPGPQARVLPGLVQEPPVGSVTLEQAG